MTRQDTLNERELVAQQLAQLIYEVQTQTAQVARLSSGIVNNVLGSEVTTIGADGYVVLEFGAAAGSLAVTHHGPSGNPLLIQSGSAVGSTRPSNGKAMVRIDAGCFGTVALTGHAVTVWGTPGDQITAEVFTSCVPPNKSTGGGGGEGTGVSRTTTITRFGTGFAGATAPTTYNIPAGRKSYTITVNVAGSVNSPTLDGVALAQGSTRTFSADQAGDSLEAAVLITAAGDDVELLEIQ